jgi:hypothetical protein
MFCCAWPDASCWLGSGKYDCLEGGVWLIFNQCGSLLHTIVSGTTATSASLSLSLPLPPPPPPPPEGGLLSVSRVRSKRWSATFAAHAWVAVATTGGAGI